MTKSQIPNSIPRMVLSLLAFLAFGGLSLKAHARDLELTCETETRFAAHQVAQTARVQFDDAKARTGAPTTVKIDWIQPDRTSRFGGLAAERKVRWSGLLIRSIEFSISPKVSFELLFSPTDDIYVVRRKTNGQPVTELPCRIEL